MRRRQMQQFDWSILFENALSSFSKKTGNLVQSILGFIRKIRKNTKKIKKSVGWYSSS